MNPEPPRNVRLIVHGETVPVELRYDGLRQDPQGGDLMHEWTAVTHYPAPPPGTQMELVADMIPGRTSINIQFLP